ncbi:hypothetical protein T09_3088 [Trichinella sp. T9]|nr:hypothetical protein T09_3088 [Trichinella sp. T9]
MASFCAGFRGAFRILSRVPSSVSISKEGLPLGAMGTPKILMTSPGPAMGMQEDSSPVPRTLNALEVSCTSDLVLGVRTKRIPLHFLMFSLSPLSLMKSWPTPLCSRRSINSSMTELKRRGEMGSPCRTPCSFPDLCASLTMVVRVVMLSKAPSVPDRKAF